MYVWQTRLIIAVADHSHIQLLLTTLSALSSVPNHEQKSHPIIMTFVSSSTILCCYAMVTVPLPQARLGPMGGLDYRYCVCPGSGFYFKCYQFART